MAMQLAGVFLSWLRYIHTIARDDNRFFCLQILFAFISAKKNAKTVKQ